MARNEKPPQQEEAGEGAPLWIISFADMMSLLMAFFVMLSSFSTMDDKGTKELKQIIKTTLAPYGGFLQGRHGPAIVPSSEPEGDVGSGSEKPTLENAANNKALKETENNRFDTDKVFLVESRKVFWADGVTLSADGRKFLESIALLVRKTTERLIISEDGPAGKDSELGISRAVVAAEYLCRQGMPRSRCNIGPKRMTKSETPAGDRMFEITLLEEHTYK